jgi:outer membrane protein TolC
MKKERAPLGAAGTGGRLAFLACTLLLCAPLRAETLGWEQSVAEAARQNSELRAARATLESARHRARAAYSGYLPQLSAGASYSESSGSAITNTDPAYSASLNLTQNLFAGYLDEGRVEKEKAAVESAQASYDAARARLSNDLKAAFAGLRFAQDNIELAASIVRRRQENMRLVELRFGGGRENKGSYLLTRAALAQAELEALQARQALSTTQQQLARALGRSAAEELAVSGTVPVSEPGAAPVFADLVQATPDYRQAAMKERGAQADVKIARAGFYPSVNLTGTLAREGTQWVPPDERRTIGVNLSYPLYSGGRDHYGTLSAAEAAGAARDELLGTERQVLVRLRQTHAAYVEAVERLRVEREFLLAAETRAEIARARYGNGLMSFEDWDRIESDLIQRQKAYLQSQRDRVTAEAIWEQAQGRAVIP